MMHRKPTTAATVRHHFVRDPDYAAAIREWIVERSKMARPVRPVVRFRELEREERAGLGLDICGNVRLPADDLCWRCGGGTEFYRRTEVFLCQWCGTKGAEPIELPAAAAAVPSDAWPFSRNHCLLLVDLAATLIGGATARGGDDSLTVQAADQFGADPAHVRFGPQPNGFDTRRRYVTLDPGPHVRDFVELVNALGFVMHACQPDKAIVRWQYAPLEFAPFRNNGGAARAETVHGA